jgi:hypothetical protein
MTDTDSRTFYHGTKADLKPGEMLQPGYSSNYTERRSPWIYFSETVFAATWGTELAKGECPGRIYVVEPTGDFMDDPNLLPDQFTAVEAFIRLPYRQSNRRDLPRHRHPRQFRA